MKKIILYIAFLLVAGGTFAQQSPLYSMYMFNEIAYNPAVAGLNSYAQAQVNNRYQFVGVENAPITATISLNGGLGTLPMGWGGLIYNDSQGAFNKFGVYGTYSYHLHLGTYSKLSFGLSVGAIKYDIDMTKIQFLDDDPNINVSMYTSIRPDATAGIYYAMRNNFVGISVDQLFNNRIEVYSDTLAIDNALNRFKSHLTLVAGNHLKMTENLKLSTTALVRKVYASPWQAEISTRVSYKNAIWGGVSVRTQDAVVLFLGYTHREMLTFGYSYDITYTKMKAGSRGAHEVMLAVNFNKKSVD